jgi:hypothetical protein
MLLCKYCDENGLDILQNLRLKASNPLALNDPFEFCAEYLAGELTLSVLKKYFNHPRIIDRLYERFGRSMGAENKKRFKEIIRGKDKLEVFKKIELSLIDSLSETLEVCRMEFSQNSRLLCFCDIGKIRCHEDILMWSHYSNAHSGMRLSFESDNIKLRYIGPLPVKYSDDMLKIDLKSVILEDKVDFKKFGDALTLKSNAWFYEHEYRWLIYKADCFSGDVNGLFCEYIRIPPSAITRVDLGINCSEELRQEVRHMLESEQFKHVELYNVTKDKRRFQLNYEKAKQK